MFNISLLKQSRNYKKQSITKSAQSFTVIASNIRTPSILQPLLDMQTGWETTKPMNDGQLNEARNRGDVKGSILSKNHVMNVSNNNMCL